MMSVKDCVYLLLFVYFLLIDVNILNVIIFVWFYLELYILDELALILYNRVFNISVYFFVIKNKVC